MKVTTVRLVALAERHGAFRYNPVVQFDLTILLDDGRLRYRLRGTDEANASIPSVEDLWIEAGETLSRVARCMYDGKEIPVGINIFIHSFFRFEVTLPNGKVRSASLTVSSDGTVEVVTRGIWRIHR